MKGFGLRSWLQALNLGFRVKGLGLGGMLAGGPRSLEALGLCLVHSALPSVLNLKP